MISKNLECVNNAGSKHGKRVVTYFHPIVSIKDAKVIGVEALSRGVTYRGEEVIPPQKLFNCAERASAALSLDRLCSRNALNSFKNLDLDKLGMMLFINLHSSTINIPCGDYNGLISRVYELGLNPGSIAVEIPESIIQNERALERFLATFKYHGFVIALDDVGKGYSNLNRIPIIKPYLIKIDRSIVLNIENDYYKQKVFKSLSNLGKNIGALVVAEGIETEEEALAALELGADFLQGYYFVEPSPLTPDGISTLSIAKIYPLAKSFIKRSSEKFHRHKFNKFKFCTAQRDLLSRLQSAPARELDGRLKEIVHDYAFIECAYILDGSGKQITETAYNYPRFPRMLNSSFLQTALGASHRFKEHFYVLKEVDTPYYQSAPFISQATGNHCVTISSYMKSRDNRTCILCIDFIA